MTLSSPRVSAQEDRPEIMPGERKVPRKKDLGPRALAVMQLGDKGKASLVPVAILINGRFYDASAYKADPVPMALESGTVYEAERAGNSLGLFTVNTALHSNSANAEIPWLGTGAWVPAGTEAPRKGAKAEKEPIGIEPADAPPRLTRAGGGQKETPPAASAPSGNAAPSTNPPANAPSSDDDRPRLTRPSDSGSGGSSGSGQTGSSQPAPGSAGQGSSGQASSAPGSGQTSAAPKPQGESKLPETKTSDGKSADKKEEAQNVPASDSGTAEANRPRLRRGKPAQPFADEDIPGYSKPGAAPSAPVVTAAKPVIAAKPNYQLIPAISDAHGPEPRSYTYEWGNKDEENERRQQITDLAKAELRKYLAAQSKAGITPQPAGSKTARHAPAAKSLEPILENENVTAYDVWATNQPVLIFSAEAHMPAQAGSTALADPDLRYSVLLVAYPDMYSAMHKIYAGITDRYHLDVTPRLELVDAVDADGDGRGELLFRETSDAGSGWAIYRPTGDTLWKMFDSLNAE